MPLVHDLENLDNRGIGAAVALLLPLGRRVEVLDGLAEVNVEPFDQVGQMDPLGLEEGRGADDPMGAAVDPLQRLPTPADLDPEVDTEFTMHLLDHGTGCLGFQHDTSLLVGFALTDPAI